MKTKGREERKGGADEKQLKLSQSQWRQELDFFYLLATHGNIYLICFWFFSSAGFCYKRWSIRAGIVGVAYKTSG